MDSFEMDSFESAQMGKIKTHILNLAAEATKPATPYTERGLKLAELASKVGGCSHDALCSLLEEVTGVSIPRADDLSHSFRMLLPVVPTSNSNGHNYSLSEVALLTRDGRYHGGGSNGFARALKQDGTEGNWIGRQFRVATGKEIECYFKNLTPAGKTYLMSLVVVV